jgi:hypothetical protein
MQLAARRSTSGVALPLAALTVCGGSAAQAAGTGSDARLLVTVTSPSG